MALALFAGLFVSDLDAASDWYDRLFGDVETFRPNGVEKVWTLAEDRSVYVEVDADRAGRSHVTLFVDDLDERVAAAASRGIEPATVETYENGVRKITFRDPDGNEVGLGGGPVSE